MPQPNLVLTGFMGTGKTTIGLLLSQLLNMPFLDTDHLIEEKVGLTVREIFDTHGEPAFREHERATCLQLASRPAHVIATGGGALLDPVTLAAFQQTGIVVLLTCSPHALIQRLRESALRGERPLLRHDFEEATRRLLAERAPIYSSIKLQLDTTHLSPGEAADRALTLYLNAAHAAHEEPHHEHHPSHTVGRPHPLR